MFLLLPKRKFLQGEGMKQSMGEGGGEIVWGNENWNSFWSPGLHNAVP